MRSNLRRNGQSLSTSATNGTHSTGKAKTPEPPVEPIVVSELPKKGWLYRMQPPKGGTEPPDAKFMAVAAVIGSAGVYAWTVDTTNE